MEGQAKDSTDYWSFPSHNEEEDKGEEEQDKEENKEEEEQDKEEDRGEIAGKTSKAQTDLELSSSTGLDCYSMSCSPHGIAVVISNSKFEHHNERRGNEVDEQNIIETFRYLGYIVEVYNNRSVSEIDGLLNRVRDVDHSKYDSFVCCILSHGNKGRSIFGSDSKLLEISELLLKFTAKNCPTLARKPKMFFIQACSGCARDYGADVIVKADSDMEELGSDFLVGYATPDGYVAWRNSVNGSWFILALCESLAKHAHHSELHHMLLQVNAEVATITSNSYDMCKEAPEFRSTLCKRVHFSPTT